MILYRLDNGLATTNRPDGVMSNPAGVPIAPVHYPHKVKYLDTDHPEKGWLLVCDNMRRYDQELADILHGHSCHADHSGGDCSWHYHSWKDFSRDSTRQRYLDKANALLRVVRGRGFTDEGAFDLAQDVIAVI